MSWNAIIYPSISKMVFLRFRIIPAFWLACNFSFLLYLSNVRSLRMHGKVFLPLTWVVLKACT